MNEITSRKNPLVVHMKKLGTDGDHRRACGEFLCDGEKLLKEALQYGAEITAVLHSGEAPAGIPRHIPVYSVPYDILETVSPLKTPQSIVFSCRMKNMPADLSGGGFHIILEGIQDPGNVGTVLRTAGAFGVDSVILTGACADPYHPKTIRATMGAIFRQPIKSMTLQELAALKTGGLTLYGAALTTDSRDIREVALKNAAVAIGSEGGGLSKALLDLCNGSLIIPMAPDCESLNAAVAAGIIMWEAKKSVV